MNCKFAEIKVHKQFQPLVRHYSFPTLWQFNNLVYEYWYR